MKSIKFTKMQGSGNDFVVIEGRQPPGSASHRSQIRKICDRIYGIGADGVLLLERSKKAYIKMRIFNADGSEAEMCGNGARCAALYISQKAGGMSHKIRLETKAGMIEAEVKGDKVKIKLTDPIDLKLDLHVNVGGKDYEIDYLNTGVPHAVIEVDDLGDLPVGRLGHAIRHHEVFRPAGTNVDFIKIVDKGHISVRTYERGVEDETLACGTGSVASAIIAVLNSCGESPGHLGRTHKVCVKTRSAEKLTVYFKALKKKITDVWLEGKAKIVYRGDYYV
ncbi:MAG TPA: diaminopimelate epimerase [Candidatus Omnitrophica bacterium]|nr:diaminopimelate epimerase [Candidatus Omnitrophota bacterium]